jgi:multicomponent K+:H+ antiporter subunit A
MNLLLVVLLPLAGAALAGWVSRFGRMRSAWTAGAITALALIALLPSARAPFRGETVLQRWSWIPEAGLDLVFRLDGLGLLFALLILCIGLLIILYARYYLAERDCLGRFYAYLLLFMGSMLGIVLSESLILLLIFWEMTSLSSFLLISYWRERDDARRGARMALTITGLGGLSLLGGFLLLGEMAGSYELSVVLASGERSAPTPSIPPCWC